MSTSCTREAHFHKIAFSDSDIFLEAKMMKKGSQNGTQMDYKIIQKTEVCLIDFGPFLEAFGNILGVKIPSKIECQI